MGALAQGPSVARGDDFVQTKLVARRDLAKNGQMSIAAYTRPGPSPVQVLPTIAVKVPPTTAVKVPHTTAFQVPHPTTVQVPPLPLSSCPSPLLANLLPKPHSLPSLQQ